MGQNSAIEWTNDTANLWIGCMKVHAGCDNCYAETLDNRWQSDKPSHWGGHANRKIVNNVWDNLKRWQALAKSENTIRRVFVGSMMDIFEKPYALENSKGVLLEGITTGDLRDRFFNDIVPNSPNLMFLLLTKRPSNINKYIPETWKSSPPTNVMFGTSPVDQITANQLIPELLKVNGKRFLSCEPLLGSIDLSVAAAANDDTVVKLLWVIVGGESGNNKEIRPMNKKWVRNLLYQCQTAKIPFFFKQWGNYKDGTTFMNKNGAGSLLDGVSYKEFPL